MKKFTVLNSYRCKQTPVIEADTLIVFETEHDDYKDPLLSHEGQWWYVYMLRPDGLVFWKKAWSSKSQAERDYEDRVFVRKTIESL